jgi:hypothetical protein
MGSSAGTGQRKREMLEAAAREMRRAQGTDRDELLSARRALRQAERTYDLAIDRAQRDVAIARAPTPIAAYGHGLILYDDRLSTPDRTHELTPAVRAHVEPAEGHGRPLLVVEGPDWSEQVGGRRHDEQELRKLAEAIETAAGDCEAQKAARRPDTEAAEGRLAAARVERLGIEEAKPLLDRVAELTDEGERVLDMAPGITTGHEGVLVATDRRLLFVGLRLTMRVSYGEIEDVHASGKHFGTRLTISTANGKSVVGGIPARHAAELVDLARRHIGAPSVKR